jgi:gluconokinase
VSESNRKRPEGDRKHLSPFALIKKRSQKLVRETLTQTQADKAMFIIFMGVSGCGKTTIGKKTADKLGVPYYEGDEFHPLTNIEKMSQGIPLTDEDREDWLSQLSLLIQTKLDAEESGVLSCSALKEIYRKRLCIDPDRVHFIYLKGNYDLILSRLRDRTDHYMPAHLLASQFEALEEPNDVFTVDINQATEAILDEVFAYLVEIGFADNTSDLGVSKSHP